MDPEPFKPPAVGRPLNPFRRFKGFFIPEALTRYRGLSCGPRSRGADWNATPVERGFATLAYRPWQTRSDWVSPKLASMSTNSRQKGSSVSRYVRGFHHCIGFCGTPRWAPRLVPERHTHARGTGRCL